MVGGVLVNGCEKLVLYVLYCQMGSTLSWTTEWEKLVKMGVRGLIMVYNSFLWVLVFKVGI